MTDAPPSTRRSVIGVPLAFTIASMASRVWYAIDSTTARVILALVLPRVIPTMVPRAYGSHHGDPSPVNAGTTYTPPESLTLSATDPASAALSITWMPSRSHWIAAPVTKIAPSSAYATVPSANCHAIVVSIPSLGGGQAGPTFRSTKLPVP